MVSGIKTGRVGATEIIYPMRDKKKQKGPRVEAFACGGGIIDTGERLHHGIITKTELTIGWCVHPHRTMDDTVLPPMLIQRRQQSDIPARSSFHLVHNQPINELLPFWIRLHFRSYLFIVHLLPVFVSILKLYGLHRIVLLF